MIRAACIGTGGISAVHLRYLKTRADVTVAGLCDLDEGSLRRRQSEFGGEGFQDFRLMLDAVRPHAVWLCTPPHFRREPLLACAERGIPVFCEKPAERHEKQAAELAADLATRGARVQVGYVFRSMPAIQRLREQMASDRIHSFVSLYACDVGLTMGLPPWFYDKAASGGALVDQGTHNLDLLRYLLGEVEEVRGLARNPVRQKCGGYSIDEAIAVSLAFRAGAVGSHVHTWVGRGWRNEVALIGEKRFYRLDPFLGRLTIEDAEGSHPFEQDSRPNHDYQNERFLAQVVSGDWSACPSTYADAVKTLELTMTCDRALRPGGSAGGR